MVHGVGEFTERALSDVGPRPGTSPVDRTAADTSYPLREQDPNKKAQATFTDFPPSARRDYVEWITEAKRDDTRTKRLKTAVKWLAQGKRRNWKYENC